MHASPDVIEIDNAFRYKTRFRNRQGGCIGTGPALHGEGEGAAFADFAPGADIAAHAVPEDCDGWLSGENFCRSRSALVKVRD